MKKIKVTKSAPLKGVVRIDGAKNAVLPIIASTLLAKGTSTLYNVPDLTDVHNICDLLKHLGADVTFNKGTLTINATNIKTIEAPYELVSKMRASFLVMGPLLARFNHAKISMPGGCAIGTRPIDLHLKGFRALNTTIDMNHGCIEGKTDGLIGNKIYLDFPSVGATQNIVMASTLAKGKTVIKNVAKEPEIIDFIKFLKKLGANISGEGTDTITVIGVDELIGAEHSVMSDRIEAMTYMVASAITKGDITLENVTLDILDPVTAKLEEAGCIITETDKGIRVIGPEQLNPVSIKTLPHPGFPTDAQAQFMALNAIATTGNKVSRIEETVFENRFMHVAEFNRMGANIEVDGKCANIVGVSKLSGANVKATDLRAGASLILCGLIAEGETIVEDIYHILRGYSNIIEKITNLGGNIELIDVNQ